MKRILLAVISWLGGMAALAQTPTPQWRPLYHFAPEKNWTNDPNGLLYLDGEYLLYNQQNPYENKWGHMSWGHARSKDLLHWEHLPIAIPEKIDRDKGDTTWIFSGSAVWDAHNTSGFCKGGGCLVAIYTADQPHIHKESQYVAYSNDGGMSFTDYPGNPVIDLDKRDFRDPNVFWHKGSAQWVMTVALPAEHKVRFYGSPNLKQWTLLSEFGPQGYVDAHWECPFLIELPVEGGTKWVLMNSAGGRPRGTYMQYFVGSFDGKTFTNDNATDKVLTVDEGDCFYAAIPWNNAPHDEKIFIGWMVPHQQKTYPWMGQMSIPRDLSLEKTPDGYRLLQQPAAVLHDALPAPATLKDIRLTNAEQPIAEAKGNAYWLEAEIDPEPRATAGFRLAGSVIRYDPANHQLMVDKRAVPLGKAGNRLHLLILLDKSSLEVFTGKGEHVVTMYIYPDEGATGCAAFAEGGSAAIKQLKIWDMSGF